MRWAGEGAGPAPVYAPPTEGKCPATEPGMVSKMEVASASGLGIDYPRVALRTRRRRQERSACHAPGRKFCKLCQSTLDRVRLELAAGGR